MKKSKLYEEIFAVDAEQLTQKNEQVKDLVKQLSVDTATWGLSVYEQDYGIPTDKSKSYPERRALIKSRMIGSGTVKADLIEAVALSFTGGKVRVGFDDGKIQIEFIDMYGVPDNMTDFKTAIDDIKPAHLGILYLFKYVLWSQLDNAYLTWDELDELNLTWGEFEVYDFFAGVSPDVLLTFAQKEIEEDD